MLSIKNNSHPLHPMPPNQDAGARLAKQFERL